MSSLNRYPFYRGSTPFLTSSSSPLSHHTDWNSETRDRIPSSSSLYRTLDSSPPSPIGPSDENIYRHKICQNELVEVYPTCKVESMCSIDNPRSKEHAQSTHLSMAKGSAGDEGSPETDIKTTGRTVKAEGKKGVVYEQQLSTSRTSDHMSRTTTFVYSIDQVSQIYPFMKLSAKRYAALRRIQTEELGILVEDEQDDGGEQKIPLGWIGEEIGEGIVNLLCAFSSAQKSDSSVDH